MASRPLSSSTPASQEPPDFEDFLDTFPIPVPPKDAAKPKKARVPSRASGIDINCCKTPGCANFGVPVQPTAQRGPGAENPYTVVAHGKGIPSGRCNCCGVSFPIKSNAGVHEEYWRISTETFPDPSCPNPLCGNHRVGVSAPGVYHAFGMTKAGSQRYRCKDCSTTFSVKPKGGDPAKRHRQADKNPLILRMLAGKMPLRRICEAADIAPRVLYERIDFFHRQALAFLADQEARLPSLEIPRLYIGVDRQDHAINWTRRKDRKNVMLSAVASADNASGYVFGMHPNFDPESDPEVIEKEAFAINDAKAAAPHRRFARLWLQCDYDAAVGVSARKAAAGSLAGQIQSAYGAASRRADIESPDAFTKDEALPGTGMLVHSEYTLYGHFLHLSRLFAKVGKVRFFLDQDSGMRGACLGAFAERILARTADALYVSCAKEMTIDQKRQKVAEARAAFDEEAAQHPGLSEEQVNLILLKARLRQAQPMGPWKDRWIIHPLPSMSEPEKASCMLTDFGDYDEDHLAWLHNKASLHAVDSWFNRLRRRSSMLERPVRSSGNQGRTWSGYSAYRPEQIAKIMAIYRTLHNYVWIGEGKKTTPAMRLGLADKPFAYEDILAFS